MAAVFVDLVAPPADRAPTRRARQQVAGSKRSTRKGCPFYLPAETKARLERVLLKRKLAEAGGAANQSEAMNEALEGWLTKAEKAINGLQFRADGTRIEPSRIGRHCALAANVAYRHKRSTLRQDRDKFFDLINVKKLTLLILALVATQSSSAFAGYAGNAIHCNEFANSSSNSMVGYSVDHQATSATQVDALSINNNGEIGCKLVKIKGQGNSIVRRCGNVLLQEISTEVPCFFESCFRGVKIKSNYYLVDKNAKVFDLGEGTGVSSQYKDVNSGNFSYGIAWEDKGIGLSMYMITRGKCILREKPRPSF